MVGTSKVLTVSYGTFSCTLEGFDDSFSTMKAIAEYFRDLAADDRYFGAEPPTPDAEMLARIAQREISRNVEAKIGENGVVLRATPGPAELAPASPAAAPEAAPQAAPAAQVAAPPPAPVQPERTGEAEFEPAEGTAEGTAEEFVEDTAEQSDDLSSVAAKLRRIRSVVQHAEAANATSIYSDDDNAAAFFEGTGEPSQYAAEADEQDIPAMEAAKDAEPKAEPLVLVQDDVALAEPKAEAEEMEAEQADQPDEIAEVEEAEADDHDAAVSDVMARLAAVAPSAQDEDEDEYQEDLQPADVTEDSDFAAETQAEIQAESAFDDAAEVEVEVEVEDEVEVDEIAEDDDQDHDDAILAAAANAMSEQEMPEQEMAEQEMAEQDTSGQNDADDDYDDEAEDEAEAASDIHIVKVKQDVLEAAVAADSMSDILAPHLEAASAETKDDASDLDPSSLSDEDEADLMAELAEVQADLDDDQGDEDEAELALQQAIEETNEADEESAEADTDDADDDTEDKPDQIGQAVAHSLRRDRRAVLVEGNDDASLSRILEHTNTELQSGEGTRRRAAIAHLKAAVAATVADRKDGKPSQNDEEKESAAYRDDLAQVVRPRRLSAKGTDARPRQAPLMLVSELRIDRPAADNTSSPINVRPRRVTKGNLAIQLDEADTDEEYEAGNVFSDGAFARFAAERGASELPDLLEAAAAYACFVEGRPHFSRPQVMKEVARAQPENTFSREEGLRSFGTLLRQGKIRKLKRGQFVVSEETRFRPKTS